MESSMFVLLSGMLTFGVPLVWGVADLMTLKRGGGGGGGGHDPVPDIAPAPPPPSLETPRPLPACLIPSLPLHDVPAEPARLLEPV